MKKLIILILQCGMIFTAVAGADYPYRSAKMNDVKILPGLWLSRYETNRIVTVWTDFKKSEETERIANFARAGRLEQGKFSGIPFNDSDVYKILEGAAYTLRTHPDAKLEAYVDDVIRKIAAAQEPDGYLYTARTLGFINGMTGPRRWTAMCGSHELYNVGHLYEAAVAYYEVTGKRTLLDVAIRNADLLDKVFGMKDSQLKNPPGHEEIEIGLCKLYRVTGNRKYLNLAKFFIDMRGRKDLRKGLYGENVQDHLPVLEQKEAVGHAVRAGYLYAGMADIAALTGDRSYGDAIETLWKNVVGKKLHLSGGIGATKHGEAFGANYELPNESAYLETCAAIANALWNQRMFLMHGDAKYVDVLERILYNGFLSGISLTGDEFFYPNPLASFGDYKRSKWFGCSCCPVNIVRFIPQIGTFAYAQHENDLYLNLFLASEATMKLPAGNVTLKQETLYPYQGNVRVHVTPASDEMSFALKVRIPGWAVGRPVPSDLYTQVVPGTLNDVALSVNGEKQKMAPDEKGYLTVRRVWKKGDLVTVNLNMPARQIRANQLVKADTDRLAVERGPILYCAEAVDNNGRAMNLLVKEGASFAVASVNILGNTFPALHVAAESVYRSVSGKISMTPVTAKLIPYFAWCHRGLGEMQVWLPKKPDVANAINMVTVKVSHVHHLDHVSALYDRVLPVKSSDHQVKRMTFWPKVGTEEWVSYVFPDVETIREVSVYWFDDTGIGSCRFPASWKAQKLEENGTWTDIRANYSVRKDEMTRVVFSQPVQTKSIRLLIQLQPKMSAGILEWQLK